MCANQLTFSPRLSQIDEVTVLVQAAVPWSLLLKLHSNVSTSTGGAIVSTNFKCYSIKLKCTRVFCFF